ncbi:hypothetical protein [Rheinheimera sp.]|uniref:hypothetical protein n=1 Tax=Rheinheimera sp. TaxID=1869214 RepID=UPI002353180C|nr:hypothetical protein [Rheinheimera sp.]
MTKQVVQKLIRIRHFEHINLAEFWQYIKLAWNERDSLVMKKNRALYVDLPENGPYKDYVLGLLVSFKDETTQTSMAENAAGKKVISVSDIAGGMDYNFFIMSKVNGVAIYQYYHESASDSVMQEMLRQIYLEYKEPKLQAELDAIPLELGKTKRSKAQVQIKKKWHKCPKVSLVVKKGEFAKVLSEWQKINTFKYQLEEFSPSGTAWTPLSNYVRSEKRILNFEAGCSPMGIAKAIDGVRHLLKRGTVSGVDEVNANRTVDLIDISENIAVYDFDMLSKKIDGLAIEDFTESKVFEWILESVTKKADFNKSIKDDDGSS